MDLLDLGLKRVDFSNMTTSENDDNIEEDQGQDKHLLAFIDEIKDALCKDCSHENVEEAYCQTHCTVVCTSCKNEKHQKCSITSVEDAAAELRQSGQVEDMLKELENFSDVILISRENEYVFLERRKKEILEQVHNTATMIGEHISNLQDQLKEDLCKMHKNNLSRLAAEKAKCTNLQRLAGKDASELREIYSDNKNSPSSIIKTMVKIFTKCPVYEKFLKDIYDGIENFDYRLYPIEETQRAQQTALTFGSVLQIPVDVNLPPFLKQDTESKDQDGQVLNASQLSVQTDDISCHSFDSESLPSNISTDSS